MFDSLEICHNSRLLYQNVMGSGNGSSYVSREWLIVKVSDGVLLIRYALAEFTYLFV